MKTRTILGILGVLSAGAAVALFAGEGQQRGDVRHGLWFDGCDAVVVVDSEAWGAHVLELVQVRIGEGRRDAATLLAEAYAETIPECEWPPSEDSAIAAQWAAMLPGAVTMIESWFPEGEGTPQIHVDTPETLPSTEAPPLQLHPAKADAVIFGRLLG